MWPTFGPEPRQTVTMKLDEKIILNVIVALLAFEVLNRLFLADLIDQVAPAKKGFEQSI